MKLESVIFDLDGTLIDSVSTYFKMLDIIMERVNLPPVSKEVVMEIMKGGYEVWDLLIPENMRDRKAELLKRIMDVGQEVGRQMFQEEVKLIPGVPQIFSKLSANHIHIGIVTSTHARYLEGKMLPLKKNGIYDLIDAVIVIEDAPKIKPAPDPLIECARRLGVSRDKCLYVGDSQVDMKAGKAAGMMTIGVLTGTDDYETLKAENPDKILDSVNELNEMMFEKTAIREKAK
jgi:HAD superfamily hydrolase (TIGR01509 family)